MSKDESKEKVTRRQALSTAGKAAIGLGIVAAAGIGTSAYLALRPPEVVTNVTTVSGTATTATVAAKKYAGRALNVTSELKGLYQWYKDYMVPQYEDKYGAIARWVFGGDADGNDQKVTLDFTSKTGAYDVVQSTAKGSQTWGTLGHLLPLDDMIKNLADSDYDWNDQLPCVTQEGLAMNHGKIIGLPNTLDIDLYYYRKDIFQQKGITFPTDRSMTYDELYDICKQLNDPPNMYALAMRGKYYTFTIQNFCQNLWSFGGEILAKDLHPVFNDDKGVAALEAYCELAKYCPPGFLAYGVFDVHNAFATGKVAMETGPNNNVPALNDPNVSKVLGKYPGELWGCMGYHPTAVKGQYGITTANDNQFCISKYTDPKNVEAAFKFIEMVSSKSIMKQCAINAQTPGQNTTNRASVITDPDVLKLEPANEMILKASPYSRPMPQLAEWAPTMALAIVANMQAAVKKEKTPKQALDDAAAECEKILKDAGYFKS